MPPGGGFTFGPFQLDVGAKRLLRDGQPVPLTARHFDLLHVLVSRAGDVVTTEALLKAAWPDVVVEPNNVAQAIGLIRTRLDARQRSRYIETAIGRGYRFAEPVARCDVEQTDADIEAQLEPHRALVEGRAALETLILPELARGRALFEALVRRDSRNAMYHVGLANACVLHYEATRADAVPDTEALKLAVLHARLACRLDANYGEAWATLGYVLACTGDRATALAALRQSVTLEPDNWRHYIRLSFVSWGEERLRAARRVLALLPGLPLAHCLVATVYIARSALVEAERELDAGIAAMSAELTAARFSAVALYWLKGLLCLARGAVEEALRAFERELALESRGHLYARECCANTWYAIGACQLQRDEHAAARAALEQAIRRVPKHPMAHAGHALLAGNRLPLAEPGTPLSIEVAMANAAMIVADGDVTSAARLVYDALTAASSSNAGWLVPIDPLLNVERDRDAWAQVLALLRTRSA